MRTETAWLISTDIPQRDEMTESILYKDVDMFVLYSVK